MKNKLIILVLLLAGCEPRNLTVVPQAENPPPPKQEPKPPRIETRVDRFYTDSIYSPGGSPAITYILDRWTTNEWIYIGTYNSSTGAFLTQDNMISK